MGDMAKCMIAKDGKPVKPALTAERLRELFSYDPNVGDFIRIPSQRIARARRKTRNAIIIRVGHRSYEAARLAWLYVYGEWPPKRLFHINGNRADNRIANLKLEVLKGKRQWPTVTLERLRGAFIYDPETGEFWRRCDSPPKQKGLSWRAGDKVVGFSRHDGYIIIGLDMRRYLAHRLAWLYVHGHWPPDQIDHVNLDPSDNRIANLRLATGSENLRNTARNRRNKSGFKGVTRSSPGLRPPWQAIIVIREAGKKRQLHLGYFATPEEAHAAYVAAAQRYFGEFARAA